MAQPKWRQAITTDERRRYWQTQIDKWQQSGKPQRLFCADNQLSYSTFCYWPKAGEILSVSGQELNWLLDGFDIFNNPPHHPLYFDTAI